MAGLAYSREGKGEPLVLLHGLGGSQRVWDPVVARLRREYELIVPDLPGFGDSPRLPAGTEPSALTLAAAIRGLLDELELGRPHLVGNSLGGWIALELARQGRARTVTLVSPAGASTRAEALYARSLLALFRRATIGTQRLLPVLLRIRPARFALLAPLMAHGQRLEVSAAVDSGRSLARAPDFVATSRWLFSHQIEPFREVPCPVVIGWGRADRLLWPRQAERFRTLVPEARLVTLPGVGHVPMSDDPRMIAALISSTTCTQ
jgi:pimeloyl-ACP methyl ester carboxylesterase